MSTFQRFAGELLRAEVRFVLIGVAGINVHAHDASLVFTTLDRDVFLPPDARNLLAAWRVCSAEGLGLSRNGQPLDEPRDLLLAERVVENRARTRAANESGLLVDLTLSMAGFEFEAVWNQRRTFVMEGVEIPVARLAHIVSSKAALGREKDRLFLAAHEEELARLLPEDAADEADASGDEE